MQRRRVAERRRAQQLGRALLTISDDDPRALRRRALEALLALVEADGACFYRLGVVNGQRCVTQGVALGIEAVARCLDNIRRPKAAAAIGDNKLRNLTRPSRLERTAFVEESALWDPDQYLQSVPYKTVLEPFKLRHQLRLLAYDGDRLLGWMGVLRSEGTRPFTSKDRQRLQPLVQPVILALRAAEQLERASIPEEAGEIVLDAGGRVLHASDSGRLWLEVPGFVERLTAAVRAMDREPDSQPRSAAVGGAQTHIVRLDGSGGVRYLGYVQPVEAPTLNPDTPLTARQRQVAYYLAAGATAREAAAALGLSTETVRSHIREVYRRLGVASRAELARALPPQDER